MRGTLIKGRDVGKIFLHGAAEQEKTEDEINQVKVLTNPQFQQRRPQVKIHVQSRKSVSQLNTQESTTEILLLRKESQPPQHGDPLKTCPAPMDTCPKVRAGNR